jgi:uncharacterized cupin superfamily protein
MQEFEASKVAGLDVNMVSPNYLLLISSSGILDLGVWCTPGHRKILMDKSEACYIYEH